MVLKQNIRIWNLRNLLIKFKFISFKYVGEWNNNNMHGRGLYSWKDGRKYDGYYNNDKKHGYGIYQWADGKKYI
jgi:hypothetical protein